jgi:putative ABC transport system substrate-binding protein
MKRREFIALIGAVAWPITARAQQPGGRMPRIGVLMGFPEDDRQGRQQVTALSDGLQALGWTDGQNVRIDFHWDVAVPGRAVVVAKDVIATQPDLIVSHTTPISAAVSRLTKTIPIVFVNVVDPVASNLVTSYAQPGGNVTGFSNFEPAMGGKWVEVLKDLEPRIHRIAILFNPETAPYVKNLMPYLKSASAAFQIETIESPVNDAAGIEQAIDSLAREPDGGLIAAPDIFTGRNRELIIRLSMNHHLPFIAAYRDFTEAGGLVSYGSNPTDIFRRAASYVDRILRGAKPADLPVQTPTKFEMVINLKTAKALGLTPSHDFLMRADDIIG